MTDDNIVVVKVAMRVEGRVMIRDCTIEEARRQALQESNVIEVLSAEYAHFSDECDDGGCDHCVSLFAPV